MRHRSFHNLGFHNKLFDLPKSRRILNLFQVVAIFLLLLLSIIPLGSEDSWYQSAVVSFIFIVSVFNLWLPSLEDEYRLIIKPILFLAAYSFLQGFASISVANESSFFPISFDPMASFWSGFKILTIALFLWILLKTYRHNIKLLCLTLLLVGNAFAVFGLARYLFQSYFGGSIEMLISPKLAVGIGFGTYFNQNHFAYLMLMVFGLNISLFWYGNLSKGKKLILLFASLLAWTSLVLSGSRGGIISSFVEIAFLILFPLVLAFMASRRRPIKGNPLKFKLIARQFAILTAISGILLFGVIIIGQERVVERFDEIPNQISGATSSDTFLRTDVWKAAMKIIQKFPVFGIGFGGFQVAVSEHIQISGQIVPKQVHNDYLELAASGGLISVALVCWFLFRFLALVKKRFTEPSTIFSGVLRFGAICGLAGTALHNFFDFGLQIPANYLFIAGLICLAIHKPYNKNYADLDHSGRTNGFYLQISLAVLFSLLAFFAAVFGVIRLQIEQSRSTTNQAFFENDWFRIPFEVELYLAKSDLYNRFEDFYAAQIELEKAIKYRPRDYKLWIKAAQISQSQNNQSAAEDSYLRAIELAPYYGEPFFEYGKHLLKLNRKEEAFIALRKSSDRNPKYFADFVAIVLNDTTGNTNDALNILLPLNRTEKEKLTSFLFEKAEFTAIAQLNCQAKDSEEITEPFREGIVRQLLEKREYYLASQISKRNCDTPVLDNIEDGSFANRTLREGTGFGWRFEKSTDNTLLSFDDGNDKNIGNDRSLKLSFNGSDRSFALLSQIVPVEKRHKYRLMFSYKTEEIISGGIPIVQIILKQKKQENAEHIVGETRINPKMPEWTQSSIVFSTEPPSEAIEIRLTREGCAQQICPIFGHLWLDDFQLQKIN
jgi:O-antigen ligase